MDTAATTSQSSPPGWSRGRLVGILATAGLVAAVLLCALAYGIYLAFSGVHTAAKAPQAGTDESSLPDAGPQRRDAIAAAPMLEVPAAAARPTEQTSTESPTINIPAGTAVQGPALVMTGYPRTPEGAIGQLAQIDAAVLQSMSLATAREVHAAWALPGGADAESWWITASVRAFLEGAGMGQVKDSAAWVRVEPAAALVKGVDGQDWTTVCVLMKVTATYQSEGQTALGHCERAHAVGRRPLDARARHLTRSRALDLATDPSGSRGGLGHVGDHRHRNRRTLMITRSLRSTVVLVVVAAVAAVTVGVIAADRGPDAPEATEASTTSSLPARSHQVDVILTGFPHDELGAVSTAVAATRAQIGFDPDQAAAVAAVYADPAERAAFEDRARGAVAARREQAGVGPTEEPPPPASYAATPLAYNVQEVAPDLFAVHVLSWITLTSTTAEIKDHLYVGTQLLKWSDEWRLTMPAADLRRDLAEQQPPAATPGSAAFTRAGWVLIEDETQ